MVAMLERQPGYILHLAEVSAAQAKAHAEVVRRFGNVIAEFKAQYGIDPMDSSWLEQERRAAEAAGSTPTA
jgi:hypothetical protein